MSTVFEALADPTRRRILALLLDNEHPVGDLVDALGVAQPSVSKHLARLKAAGLVDLRAEAQRRVYRLTPQPLQELGGWLGPYLGTPGIDATNEPSPADAAVVLTAREAKPRGWTLAFHTAIAASPDAVWAALTEPARLEAWLGQASLEPQVGGRVRFSFAGADTALAGRVLTWTPDQALECRLRIQPKDDGTGTRVRFDLSADNAGTSLGFIHSGLPAHREAELAALWQAHLERLAPALRGETPPPPEERIEALKARYAADRG